MEKSVASINDVAKQAGVSAMTVSRAFNEPDRVKEETRKKIIAVASELGYIKDVYASINAQKRSRINSRKNVLLVSRYDLLNSKSNSMYQTIFFTLMRELQDDDIGFKLIDIDEPVQHDLNAIYSYSNRILASNVAVILGPVNEMAYQQIKTVHPGIQIISVCYPVKDTHIINPDDKRGGELAAELLHKNRHHRAAVFVHMNIPNHAARYRSFADKMKKLENQADIFLYNLNTYYAGKKLSLAAKIRKLFENEIIKEGQEITAVFCPNGDVAAKTYLTIKNLGLKIPDDFALIGYDTLSFNQNIAQELTRIEFSSEEIGKRAAVLIRKICTSQPKRKKQIIIPVRLVMRCSV